MFLSPVSSFAQWLANVQADPQVTTATIVWTSAVPATSKVKWGLTTSYGSNNPIDSTLSQGHGMQIKNLKANTLYHFRVMSQDIQGILVTSLDFTFTTKSHVVSMTWQPSPTPSVIYNVYRAALSTGPWTQIKKGLIGTAYADTTVLGGTSYYYVVRADNGTESDDSNLFQAVVPNN